MLLKRDPEDVPFGNTITCRSDVMKDGRPFVEITIGEYTQPSSPELPPIWEPLAITRMSTVKGSDWSAYLDDCCAFGNMKAAMIRVMREANMGNDVIATVLQRMEEIVMEMHDAKRKEVGER